MLYTCLDSFIYILHISFKFQYRNYGGFVKGGSSWNGEIFITRAIIIIYRQNNVFSRRIYYRVDTFCDTYTVHQTVRYYLFLVAIFVFLCPDQITSETLNRFLNYILVYLCLMTLGCMVPSQYCCVCHLLPQDAYSKSHFPHLRYTCILVLFKNFYNRT